MRRGRKRATVARLIVWSHRLVKRTAASSSSSSRRGRGGRGCAVDGGCAKPRTNKQTHSSSVFPVLTFRAAAACCCCCCRGTEEGGRLRFGHSKSLRCSPPIRLHKPRRRGREGGREEGNYNRYWETTLLLPPLPSLPPSLPVHHSRCGQWPHFPQGVRGREIFQVLNEGEDVLADLQKGREGGWKGG